MSSITIDFFNYVQYLFFGCLGIVGLIIFVMGSFKERVDREAERIKNNLPKEPGMFASSEERSKYIIALSGMKSYPVNYSKKKSSR